MCNCVCVCLQMRVEYRDIVVVVLIFSNHHITTEPDIDCDLKNLTEQIYTIACAHNK